MGLNYTEFQQFRDNFAKLVQDFENWLHQFLLTEGMRFLAEVKPRTPVDTGDLRAHWKLDGITRDGDTLHCWFVNSMDYATFVEYGHAKPYKAGASPGSADWVDGYFMMTVSLERVNNAMPARFDRALRQYLAALGVN